MTTKKKPEVLEGELVPVQELTPPQMLQRAAASGNVELLREIKDIEREWRLQQAEEAYHAALAAVAPKLPAVVKSKIVDFTSTKGRTNYKYADLGAIIESVKPVLAEYGLQLSFKTANDPQAKTVTVSAILTWAAPGRGFHTTTNTLTGPYDDSGNKNVIQAMGSAQTYLQRYTAMALLGLAATDDDDGRGAQDADAADPRISQEQVDTLVEWIAKAKVTADSFLKWAHVKNIGEIRASYYEGCLQGLKQKAKEKEAANVSR